MHKIYVFCDLSKVYTNHYIRVTSISQLGTEFSENKIQSILGHKSNSALGIYNNIDGNKKYRILQLLTYLH